MIPRGDSDPLVTGDWYDDFDVSDLTVDWEPPMDRVLFGPDGRVLSIITRPVGFS